MGEEIAKMGVYEVREALAWGSDFPLQAAESQRGVYQEPQQEMSHVREDGRGGRPGRGQSSAVQPRGDEICTKTTVTDRRGGISE